MEEKGELSSFELPSLLSASRDVLKGRLGWVPLGSDRKSCLNTRRRHDEYGIRAWRHSMLIMLTAAGVKIKSSVLGKELSFNRQEKCQDLVDSV